MVTNEDLCDRIQVEEGVVLSKSERKRRFDQYAAEFKLYLAGELARRQDADGSFGGDPRRTSAALIALVLLGHTRRKGLRKRTVAKAVPWLEAHHDDPIADLALEVLKHAEAGESLEEILKDASLLRSIKKLSRVGEEGEILSRISNLILDQ